MKTTKEKTWVWLMPSGKLYKVVTNPDDRTITVYDPNGNLVKKDEKLSSASVNLIEDAFLKTVATKIDRGTKVKETVDNLTDEIAMYIR